MSLPSRLICLAGTEVYDPVTDGGYIDDLEEYADPDSSMPSRQPVPASDPSPSLTFPSAPQVSSRTPVPVTEMLRSASLSPGPEGADDEA